MQERKEEKEPGRERERERVKIGLKWALPRRFKM